MRRERIFFNLNLPLSVASATEINCFLHFFKRKLRASFSGGWWIQAAELWFAGRAQRFEHGIEGSAHIQ